MHSFLNLFEIIYSYYHSNKEKRKRSCHFIQERPFLIKKFFLQKNCYTHLYHILANDDIENKQILR